MKEFKGDNGTVFRYEGSNSNFIQIDKRSPSFFSHKDMVMVDTKDIVQFFTCCFLLPTIMNTLNVFRWEK